jgi:hypothetical protein
MFRSFEKEYLGRVVRATVESVGKDLCITVTGGTGHIGSVSIALPRPSLNKTGENSATVSTFNVTGHLDNIIGDAFAKRMASKLNCRVAVICGIHFDDFGETAPAEIGETANLLLKDIEGMFI